MKTITLLILGLLGLLVGSVMVVDAQAPPAPCQVDEDGMSAVAWHPNGSQVAIGTNCGILFYDDHFAQIQDVWFIPGVDQINSLAWNHDASLLAVSFFYLVPGELSDLGLPVIELQTLVWDVDSARAITTIEHFSYISLVWHPLRDVFAVGSYGGEMRLYDAHSGEVLYQLKPEWRFPIPEDANPAHAACWSNQGDMLRVYFRFDTFVLAYPSFEVLAQPENDVGLFGSACNQDASILADSSGSVTHYTANPGEKQWIVANDWCDGVGVAWNPNGEQEFATNCYDQTVRVFDTQARLIAVLEGGFDGHAWVSYGDSVA